MIITAKRPCLKHAGTPGRRRDSITGRDTGRDAGIVATLYYVRPSSREQLPQSKPGRRCRVVEAGTTDSHLSSTRFFLELSEESLIHVVSIKDNNACLLMLLLEFINETIT